MEWNASQGEGPTKANPQRGGEVRRSPSHQTPKGGGSRPALTFSGKVNKAGSEGADQFPPEQVGGEFRTQLEIMTGSFPTASWGKGERGSKGSVTTNCAINS